MASLREQYVYRGMFFAADRPGCGRVQERVELHAALLHVFPVLLLL